MTPSFRLLSLALAVLWPAGTAIATEFEGHLAFGFNTGRADFDHSDTRALARLEYKLSHETTLGAAGLDLVLGGELWAGEPDLNRTHYLREGYVEFSGDAGRIGIGRQVRVQGVADGFVPTDVVAPRNFRLSRYETEGNRFGLDGIWGTVFLGENVTLSGYLYDGRRSNVMPSGLYKGGLALPDRPVDSDDPVFGGRLSYRASIGDFGISYYRGSAAYPVLASNGLSIDPVVPELEMVGLDADTVFGPWRIYGEVALLKYQAGEFDVAQGYLPDDELQAVLGVERELEGGSRLAVQLFHRALQNERDPQAGPGRDLAEAVRIVYGQFDDRQTGASLSYNWSSDDARWNVEAAASSWFHDDHYLSLRAKYSMSDKSALYLNAIWFDGPEDTLYGAFSESTNLGLEYRYFF